MRAPSTTALLVLLVLAAFVRVSGAFDNPEHVWDECNHVPSALSSNEYGTTRWMTWTHPPLSGLMLGGSIAALGDNPRGWRMNGVVFGTASVAMLYLVGLTLFPGGAIPLIAAALLALDPFHAFFSRTTMMEIPVTFFFLLYLYLMLEYAENGRRTLPLAGVALGLTIATKAYFSLAIPLVVVHSFHRGLRRGEPFHRLLGDHVLTQLLLPASVLLFSYFRWFGRGFTLPEFLQMQSDALRTLQELTIERFSDGSALRLRGEPWEWFLKPVIVGGQELLGDGETGRFTLEINNPPFRLLVVPALTAVCYRAWRERSTELVFTPALFTAVYVLPLVAGRPMFSYSALPLLPFAYLTVAHAVTIVAEWARQSRRVTAGFVGLIVLWGLYTFPLISARAVPIWLYRPILAFMNTAGGS